MSVLRHWKYDPPTDPCIRALLCYFQLAQPVQWRLMPQWDLRLVQTTLLWLPFTNGSVDRPGDDVFDFRWRMLKTTFFLWLATARRRSYLHTLCVSTCLFTWGDVQDHLVVNLLLQAEFLAKNQMPDQALQWILLPGIAHLNPDEPDLWSMTSSRHMSADGWWRWSKKLMPEPTLSVMMT